MYTLTLTLKSYSSVNTCTIDSRYASALSLLHSFCVLSIRIYSYAISIVTLETLMQCCNKNHKKYTSIVLCSTAGACPGGSPTGMPLPPPRN